MRNYLCIICTLLTCLPAFSRTWTNVKGQTFDGEFISATEEQITIKRRKDDRVFILALSSLSKKDLDHIAEISQGQNSSDELHGTSWAGKWNNERKFILTFSRDEGSYYAYHHWLNQEGSPTKQAMRGEKEDAHYRFACVHVFPQGNRATATGDFVHPYGFQTANLVKLPPKHPEIKDLNPEDYGWEETTITPPKLSSCLEKSSARMRLIEANRTKTNLLDNGGFETGSLNWKGSFKTEDENLASENQVCRLDTDSKDLKFFQEARVRNAQKITLTYDVRSSLDYSGEGFEIRFSRDDDSYTFYSSSASSNKWRTRRIEFDQIQGSKKIEVSFALKTATKGFIRFDNISLTSD